MIVVEDVQYRYESTTEGIPSALNDVTLTIPEGEFLAIIGPNGSGKSTLGYCLNGLLQPTHGRVTVDDLETTDTEHLWEIHHRVGMIFQNPDNQLVSTTVERELAFGLENLGIPSCEIRERVTWALDRFHLTSYRTYPPHRLSGGQKQQVAIAAVVAMQPRYLVCDEPTALLDPQGRKDILSLITRLRHDHRMTIVYITQFPDEAAETDRVVLMADGRIVGDGPPATLLTHSERVASCGVGVPLAVRLAEALRTRGVAVPAGVLLPEQLVTAIRQWQPEPGNDLSPVNAPASSGTCTPPCIEMRGVTHTYQPGTVLASSALNGIDLQVTDGECVALIGPNGSGKSTLIQHLNGLLTPTTGEVLIDGKNLAAPSTHLKTIRQQVGLVFQFPEAQLFEETVFDDVAFGPRNMGIENEEMHDRVNRALEHVGLDPDVYASRVPLSLSGGEKRRAAIAGILAMRPRMLALDEPTAGLDDQGVRQVEKILCDFHASGGTVVIISHNMDLVARLADRIVVMHEGRIIADDSPEILFAGDDLLQSLGLDCPGVVKILTALHEAGYPVRTAIFEVEEAAMEIVRILDFRF